jgi:D-serine deaminase-like pyridoxal phosphate-dependent protein
MRLENIETPCLILDEGTLDANIGRMHAWLASRGVGLRPHVKTAKNIEVARRAMGQAVTGITVSTLKEADYFFEHGIRDILYAVGITPGKLDHVARLRRHGADVAVVLDSAEAAQAVVDKGAALRERFPVLIEIDCDGHRAGVQPDDPALIALGRVLAGSSSVELRGVMTHAGSSYNAKSIDEIRAIAEKERRTAVRCADALKAAGLPCPVVSVGSTPTALYGESFQGITEVRAGVFVFFDLVMAGLDVCRTDEIALSVLTTVIGHQKQKGWVICDAGWMAMSRDRGTAAQRIDQAYGLVCDVDGNPVEGAIVSDANQEHGVISSRDGTALDVARFPIGALLRILPNHACATAAQHDAYHVVNGNREIVAVWERFRGW